MKKLISLFAVLSLLMNNVSSQAISMSPKQQVFYQAAIFELDVKKALNLLQQNSIDLNEFMDIDGR